MEQKEIKILSTEPIKNESEFAELVLSEILKEIQEKIQTMMSRLCINTEITFTVKYNEYSQRVVVVLQSTEFNTVPVIFKSIHLEGRSQPVVETVDNGNGIFHRIKFCFSSVTDMRISVTEPTEPIWVLWNSFVSKTKIIRSCSLQD